MMICVEDTLVRVYTILFADDQIVLAEDQQDMTYMLNKLTEEFKKWEFYVNKDYTLYINI